MWKRVGWIGVPAQRPDWWSSHAAFPTVVSQSGNSIKLIVSARDVNQRSSAAVMDLAVNGEAVALLNVSDRPWLAPGLPGTFDEAGVNVTFCSTDDDGLVAWYHGWALRSGGGWWNSIGTAKGDLTSGLTRVSAAPTFDRSTEDPTSLGYPFWYDFPWGKCLLYCTYESYGIPSRNENYSYRVKCTPGLGLTRSSPLLPHLGVNQAQSRPTVVHVGNVYRMFLSVKGNRYHIACAESLDGIRWRWSADEWSLFPLGSGGEVNEVAYSYVFWQEDRLTMLYNGDGHGATGIGVAVWND